MSLRKMGIALFAVCASLLVVPVAAGAATGSTAVTATPVKTLKTVRLTGSSSNGKQFTGRYTIQRFASRNGKTYAVGTLAGKLGNRRINRSNVYLPANVQHNSIVGAAATCPILHLVLGPLNLHLLGLNVHLNKVVLDITATSGNGNLLGNLLCGVANLLNGSGTGLGSASTSGLLNIVQQLLNLPSLLSL
jgi:hypothetical protein